MTYEEMMRQQQVYSQRLYQDFLNQYNYGQHLHTKFEGVDYNKKAEFPKGTIIIDAEIIE